MAVTSGVLLAGNLLSTPGPRRAKTFNRPRRPFPAQPVTSGVIYRPSYHDVNLAPARNHTYVLVRGQPYSSG